MKQVTLSSVIYWSAATKRPLAHPHLSPPFLHVRLPRRAPFLTHTSLASILSFTFTCTLLFPAAADGLTSLSRLSTVATFRRFSALPLPSRRVMWYVIAVPSTRVNRNHASSLFPLCQAVLCYSFFFALQWLCWLMLMLLCSSSFIFAITFSTHFSASGCLGTGVNQCMRSFVRLLSYLLPGSCYLVEFLFGCLF